MRSEGPLNPRKESLHRGRQGRRQLPTDEWCARPGKPSVVRSHTAGVSQRKCRSGLCRIPEGKTATAVEPAQVDAATRESIKVQPRSGVDGNGNRDLLVLRREQ